MFGGECTLQGGFSALLIAAEKGHADCARLLIDAGADKEAKDRVRVDCCFAWGPFLLFLHF